MKKTFKYELKEEEDGFQGHIDITVKKGLWGKPLMDDFNFFFERSGIGMTGEAYTKGNGRCYGVRKDEVYTSDSLGLAKKLHDMGVEISTQEGGGLKLVDRGDAEVSTVEGEKGLKNIIAKVKEGVPFDCSRSINATLRDDGLWDIKKRSVAIEEYTSKDKAKRWLMNDSEKWKVFEKYMEKALEDFEKE